MLKKTVEYFLQIYFFKICLAVSVIVAVAAFSSVVTLAFVLHYHYEPLVPLVLLAIFWVLIISIVYLCYRFAQQRFEMEVSRLFMFCDRFKLIFAVLSGLKKLFTSKSK